MAKSKEGLIILTLLQALNRFIWHKMHPKQLLLGGETMDTKLKTETAFTEKFVLQVTYYNEMMRLKAACSFHLKTVIMASSLIFHWLKSFLIQANNHVSLLRRKTF